MQNSKAMEIKFCVDLRDFHQLGVRYECMKPLYDLTLVNIETEMRVWVLSKTSKILLFQLFLLIFQN